MKGNSLLKRGLTVLCLTLMLGLVFFCVTQSALAKPVPIGGELPDPYLSVTRKTIGCKAQSFTVTVKNATSYAISTEYTWIKLSRSGNTITINVTANTSNSYREGKVRVVANGKSLYVNITQYGTIIVKKDSSTGAVISSLSLAGATRKGATLSSKIYVSCNGTLKVNSISSWITVSISSRTVTLKVAPNFSGSSRRGALVISNGYDSVTFYVYQDPFSPALSDFSCTDTFTSIEITKKLKDAISPFKSSNVSGYSTEDLKKYTKDLAQAIADAMYIVLPPMEITAQNQYNPNGQRVFGSYDPRTKKLTVDYKCFREDPMTAVATMAHELRHAWQQQHGRTNGTLLQYLLYYADKRRIYESTTEFFENDAYYFQNWFYNQIIN